MSTATTIDVTDATFQEEVIERSAQQLVIVDLWAEWCGPCRTLGPIIESVVDSYDGAVRLAKVDVDANPRVSQTFKVQSIPAVYAVKDQAIVDGFVGALPEAQIRQFIERHLPTEEQSEVDQLLEVGDEASLRAALELEPTEERVVTALAALLVERGDVEDGTALLATIPESPETRRIAALARAGAGAVDEAEATLESLLALVKHDEDARRRYLDLLELLGPDDPRTADYRKRLTAAIY